MLAGYLHADTFARGVGNYARYRFAATVCFFSGPRLGHDWTCPSGSGMYQECAHCDKTWLANF